jgi:hypothetical protein
VVARNETAVIVCGDHRQMIDEVAEVISVAHAMPSCIMALLCTCVRACIQPLEMLPAEVRSTGRNVSQWKGTASKAM